MAISKSAGARFYIGPVVNADAIEAMNEAAALAFFEAIVEGDWTEVEEIESFGELGDSAGVATFASMKRRRVRKLKTVRDAGTLSIVVGMDRLDDGQVALVAAEKTDFDYAMKIVYADEREEGYSPSTDYFGGMVMSRPTNIGDAQAITKRTFPIAINTSIIPDDTDPSGS